MSDTVTVIDVVAQVTDATEPGASSSQNKVSKLERSLMNLQKQIQSMKGKSKLEVAATLKDMASKGIQNVATAGKKIAGKVWTVTLKAVDLVTAPFRKVLGLISNPVTQVAAFAGISLGVADTINTFKDFEAAMASVAATAGVDKTSETFASLEKAAREAGATTTKSAAEAANALEYMSLAGWDAQTSIQALPKVLQLSEATGLELGRTSDLVTDSMAALGVTVDELPSYLDKVAKAQTSSNQSAEQLMEAYIGVGGLFKDLEIDITESATALGVLANRGTKGTEAATAMNATLLNLTTGSGEAGKMMKSLGLSAFDNKGKFIGLQNVLKQVNNATASMTQEQKNATLAAIGGKEHVSSLNKLLAGLNETNAEGVSEWDALAASIKNSSGALEDMARRKNDSLAGSLSALSSAADEAKIAIVEKLEPYIKGLVDWVTAHMPDIQNAVGSAVDFITGKIDAVMASVHELTASPEWQNAETFWEKVKLVWGKIIVEPFTKWWNSTGKAWLTEKVAGFGEALGRGITAGLLAILGFDTTDAFEDGKSIGASFIEGFRSGFDMEKIGEALKKWASDHKGIVAAAGVILGGKLLGGLIKVLQSGKNIIGILGGLFGGGQTGGTPLPSAGGAIPNGLATIGTALGSGASTLGGAAAAGTAGITGGIIGVAALVSAFKDLRNAEKTDDQKEKDVNISSGAAKASGVVAGAAIGTLILPGLGTLIGAGIGGIAGWLAGNRIKSDYAEGLEEAEAEAAKSAITGKRLEDIRFGTEALNDALHDVNVSAEQFSAMFEEAVTQRIVDAFGDISLTMQEISQIADAIVFDGATASAERFENALADSSNTLTGIKSRMSSIEKWNWKATLGIGFTEEDVESYKAAIDSYLADASEYITNKHFEATAAFQLIGGQGIDLTGLDAAYGAIEDELSAKSAELTAAVQTALEDGVISTEPITLPDGTIQLSEHEEILGLQNQINDIISKVSAAESEARLDVLQTKYGGANMDAASFQQLQAELAANVQSMTLTHDEALQVGITNLRLKFGGLSEEELRNDPDFQTQLAALKENYREQISNLNVRVESFQLDTIAQAFQTDLSTAFGTMDTSGISAQLQEKLNTALAVEPDVAKWTSEDITAWFGLEGLDTETQTAIAAMLKGVAATIPGEIKTQLGEELGKMDLSEAQDKLKNVLGIDIAEAIEATDLTGAYRGIETLRDLVKEQAEIELSKPIDVTITVNMTYDYKVVNPARARRERGLTTVSPSKRPWVSKSTAKHRATGGFTTGPEIALIGEDGPEVVIPLGVKRRGLGVQLWEEAGEKLGVVPHAEGGIMTKPHVGLVAEDGAEAIIPLSSKRRERGIGLWEQAGRMLGVRPYAEGGIADVTEPKDNKPGFPRQPDPSRYPDGPDPTEWPDWPIWPDGGNGSASGSADEMYSGGMTVPVTIQDLTFEINVDAGNAQDPQLLVETIKENVRGMTDEIAYQLAIAIQQVYANKPKAAW